MKYRTIVADPPWAVKQPPKAFGASGNAPLPYATLSLEEIAALPVAGMADDRAHLYLWTVNRFVPDAYAIAKAWGFRPSTLLTWCKRPMGQGPGYEFARRGKADYPPPCRMDRNWWEWPRGPHSAKPEAFLDIVEQVSPGPYVELFARRARFGWDYWGDESLGTAEMPRESAA